MLTFREAGIRLAQSQSRSYAACDTHVNNAVNLSVYDDALAITTNVRIRYQHWIFKLPFVRRHRGMVVSRTILFKGAETEISFALLQHELAHLDQIERHGITKFYFNYLCDYVSNLWRLRDHDAAYRQIRFEKEACELAQSACDEVAAGRQTVTQEGTVQAPLPTLTKSGK